MKKRDDVYAYLYGGNVYINLTNRCCNNCEFCLRNTGDGVGGSVLWLNKEPTAQEVIRTAREIMTPTAEEMVFCGYGEPTYRVDEMVEVAAFAHEIGLKTRLNTNGLGNRICGYDITDKLAGAIDTVSVSLNEASAAAYDKVCHSVYGSDAFEELKKFAASCAAKGIKTIMSVVDIIGEDAVRECEKIAESCGAKLRVRRYEKKW